jgi:hypothetical protein
VPYRHLIRQVPSDVEAGASPCLGIVVVAHNIRQLRSWHARTGLGDGQHPLLQADSESLLLHLTPVEYEAFQTWLALQDVVDAPNAPEDAGGKAA